MTKPLSERFAELRDLYSEEWLQEEAGRDISMELDEFKFRQVVTGGKAIAFLRRRLRNYLFQKQYDNIALGIREQLARGGMPADMRDESHEVGYEELKKKAKEMGYDGWPIFHTRMRVNKIVIEYEEGDRELKCGVMGGPAMIGRAMYLVASIQAPYAGEKDGPYYRILEALFHYPPHRKYRKIEESVARMIGLPPPALDKITVIAYNWP